MSEVLETWNTAEIKRFKEAFKQHTDSSYFFGGGQEAARKQLAEAVEMLRARKDSAVKTLGSMQSLGTDKSRKMTEELFGQQESLGKETDTCLRDVKNLSKTAKRQEIDKATKNVVALTNKWVRFESRCVSAHTMMTAQPDDGALLEALKQRAVGLNDLATDLVNSCPSQPSKQLLGEMADLMLQVNEEDADITALTAALDAVQRRLVRLSVAAQPQPKNPPKFYGVAMQKLFGVRVTAGDKADAKTINYVGLLQAFNAVPPEHARNAKLSSVLIGDIGFRGGDYSRKESRIRVSVDMKEGDTSEYVNPETGKTEKVSSFSITTLHEIGHSVDEAYGLMTAHAKDDGCGGWEEQDATVYVASDFDTNKDAIAGLLGQFLDTHYPGENIDLDEAALKQGYVRYAAGVSADEAFAYVLEDAIDRLKMRVSQATTLRVHDLLMSVIRDLDNACKSAKNGDSVDTLWQAVEGGIDALVKELATAAKSSFTTDMARIQFGTLCGGGAQVAGAVDPQQLIDILGMEAAKLPDVLQDVEKQALAAAKTWSSGKNVPKPVDLSAYGAAKKPWNLDLTGKKIGELPASHQANEVDATWWRYKDRSSTFVTSYQWRSPAEWFAEIYAISWYKKVEPPAKVPNGLRPYFYGGHVSV